MHYKFLTCICCISNSVETNISFLLQLVTYFIYFALAVHDI